MKTLLLVSYYNYDDGSLYPLVITETYEDAVRMVHVDFKEDFVLANGDHYALENEDGEYLVKNLDIEPSETDPFGHLAGFYKIEHMSLYEKPDIEDLEK
jgi:hypothetical protein